MNKMPNLMSRADFTDAAIARFWSQVAKGAKGDGCWEWTGRKETRGYGVFYFGPTQEYGAHRIVWVLVNGPIQPGKFICHHCDNPPCVRPDHLFQGTNKDNVDDRIKKGRFVRNTHCKKGHELTDDNITMSWNARGPYRLCTICKRAYWRSQYYKRIGQSPPSEQEAT